MADAIAQQAEGACLSGGAGIGVFGKSVDQPQFKRLARINLAARGDEVNGGIGPYQARQTLRAAGAGQKAQRNLGQAHPRARKRNAVMGAQGDLQPAAKNGSVQRRDDGLFRSLDQGDDIRQEGGHRRLSEFRDVGPCNEGPPRAGQHGNLRVVVLAELRHGRGQPLPHRRRKGVDGWIIDVDEGDLAFPAIADGGVIGHGHVSLRVRWGACPVIRSRLRTASASLGPISDCMRSAVASGGRAPQVKTTGSARLLVRKGTDTAL